MSQTHIKNTGKIDAFLRSQTYGKVGSGQAPTVDDSPQAPQQIFGLSDAHFGEPDENGNKPINEDGFAQMDSFAKDNPKFVWDNLGKPGQAIQGGESIAKGNFAQGLGQMPGALGAIGQAYQTGKSIYNKLSPQDNSLNNFASDWGM